MMNEYKKHFEKTRKTVERNDSREMTHMLRGQIRRKQVALQKSRKLPVGLILLLLLGAVGGYVGLHYSTQLERVVKKIEISWLGTAMAEETPADKKSETKKDAKTEVAAEAAVKVTDKREFSEDEINHFARMNERKRELDAREDELNKMEAELITQKVSLEKRINDLDQTRRNIASVLDDRVKADDKKVESLVQLYSSMKPQQAAKVFETMDEDLAIEILGRMKKKPAAEILNLVKAEKAQVLSEKYAGYKRK